MFVALKKQEADENNYTKSKYAFKTMEKSMKQAGFLLPQVILTV